MSDNKDSFPHRINPDGTVNNNYVDVLDEDKPRTLSTNRHLCENSCYW